MNKPGSLEHAGANLRAIRRRQHLTQVERARRLDMRPGPVNTIEQGRNLSESVLRATVRQLGIAPSEWTLELLCRVKHRYGVSAEAMLYRLKELDLIPLPLVNEFRAVIHAFYEEHDNSEPDASRRVLRPNGRRGTCCGSPEKRFPSIPKSRPSLNNGMRLGYPWYENVAFCSEAFDVL